MDETDAEALLEGARRGDRASIGDLLMRLLPMMRRVSWRILGNAGDADDACQEALCVVARQIVGFQGSSTDVQAWARTIAARKALDLVRKEGRIRRLHVGAREVREATGPSGRTSSSAERIDTERLAEAMGRIDPERRAVLVLRASEGLSYAQIAQALGIPLGTVQSRLARAVREVREILGERGRKEGAHGLPEGV